MDCVPVLYDCDPGHDDCVSLLLAVASPRIDLIGVTTTHGNQSVEKTTRNALVSLAIAHEKNVDVCKGFAEPLLLRSTLCPEIHGESGLDCAVQLPEPLADAVDEEPLAFMRRKILEQAAKGRQTTLVATGALTNFALLLKVHGAELRAHIRTICIMGGAINFGNISRAAEFNILIDPHAAHIVFESKLPLVMVPLDVTHTCLVTQERLAALKNSCSQELAATLEALMTFFANTYRDVFGMPDPPLHDPLAMAYVIDPTLFETKFCRVDIELEGRCAGRTLVDLYDRCTEPKNVHVATTCDIDRFWQLLGDAMNNIH